METANTSPCKIEHTFRVSRQNGVCPTDRNRSGRIMVIHIHLTHPAKEGSETTIDALESGAGVLVLAASLNGDPQSCSSHSVCVDAQCPSQTYSTGTIS